MNTYNLYYNDKDGDSHFWETYEAKNDKDALKQIFPHLKNALLHNLNGEKEKNDEYQITLVNTEINDEVRIVYTLNVFTKNGKTVDYSYFYYPAEGDLEWYDSEHQRNQPKYAASIVVSLTRCFEEIPDSYSKTPSAIKKYVLKYLKTQEMDEYGDRGCFVRIHNLKNGQVKFYYALYTEKYDSFNMSETKLF